MHVRSLKFTGYCFIQWIWKLQGQELWNPLSKTILSKCSFIWNKGHVNISNDRNAQTQLVCRTCKYSFLFLTLIMHCNRLKHRDIMESEHDFYLRKYVTWHINFHLSHDCSSTNVHSWSLTSLLWTDDSCLYWKNTCKHVSFLPRLVKALNIWHVYVTYSVSWGCV